MENNDKKISNECKYDKVDYFFIFIILILGFLIRIYKINDQSVFFDEYVTVGNFKILDIKNFYYIFFINAPDLGIAPLSAIILYCWLNIFQNYDWVWRLLPITFGMLTIICTYFLARIIGGRKVAFLTCLLFCLSPFNIWFHQELRCYAFLQFLSIISFYALLKYLYQERKRWNWFFIGAISNITLPWFHATYAIYPLFQIIILTINSKLSKKTFFWIIQCIMSPLLWGIWYIFLSPFIYNMVNPAHTRANLWDFLVRIFGNDSVGISQELLPEWKTGLSDLNKSFWTTIIKNIYIADYYILFLTIFLLLIFTWDLFNKRNKSHIFLFLSIFIPISTFLFLELIVIRKPIFHPLYFFYIFPFMYISISSTILNLKQKSLSILIVATLIFSYGVQCMSLVLYKNRTDYKCMTEYIENNAGINDVVLGQRSTTFWDIGKIYQKRKDLKRVSYYTLYQLDKEVGRMLDEYEHLWVIVETYTLQIIYQEDVIGLITKNFEKKGVNIHWKKFPGQYNLYVGQLEKKNRVISNIDNSILGVKENIVNYITLMNELNLVCEDEKMNKKNLETLKEYILMWPLFPWVNIFVINELIKEENYTIAENMCDYLIEKYPDFSDIYLLKGIVRLYLGDKKLGQECIEKAKKKNVVLAKYMYSLFTSNCENQLVYNEDFCKRTEKINCEGIMPLNSSFKLLFKVYNWCK